jgi:16S rRNA (guanine527-N7)-methyltransferase
VTTESLENLIADGGLALSADVVNQILSFYGLLVEENQSQNLTRLISPSEFYFGHLIDVIELIKSGLVDYPAIDLGSGGGIPGLLMSLIRPEKWILVESEKRKAEYLGRAVSNLGVASRVVVAPQRVEDYLKSGSAASVVARAVGSVSRIYPWLKKCSTWNNLVLLKGPGWPDEWKEFQEGRYKNELKVDSTHAYFVGPEKKHRIIVRLSRVPRGTFLTK